MGGCFGRATLDGPTTFEFRGITPQDANAVEALLRDRNLRVVRKDGGQGTTFQTRDVVSAKQLGEIHRDLLSLASKQRIEMAFEGTTVSYSSLTATGSALTTVTIQASPGATAYIADQDGKNPWRLIRLDRSGRWQGSVRTRGRVSEHGGWLYVAFTRDDALYRYLRVNVLTGEQQATSYSEAQRAGLSEPNRAVVGRSDAGTPSESEGGGGDSAPAAEPAPKKRGFKWPWEK